MPTNEKIVKKQQAVARLERQLALEKIKKRKAETRHKIQMGGLVVKAGMGEYAKDIILGALLHAKKDIENDKNAKLMYQSLGKAAFMDYLKDDDDGNNDSNR